jgi:hypothetical protein
MPAAAVMGVAAVAGAAAQGIAGSKAAKAQKKAAMQAAALQAETTRKNVALQTDLYDKNTDLAGDTYRQQLADNSRYYGDATGAINTGYDQGGQDIRQGYGSAIDTMQPFASPNALMQLYDMGGVARPGEETARAYDFKSTDPSYQWRFNQGQAALDRSAASRGMLLSGAQLKASQEYGGNAASQEYGAQFNRVSGMANQAQSAAGTVANLQQGQGTALANLATGRGSALGNMAIGQGTALNSLGQTNLSNLSTLNTNFGNTLSDLNQTGALGVNANNQNAAQARASGYLTTGKAISGGLQGLASMYGGLAGGGAAGGQALGTPQSSTVGTMQPIAGNYGGNYGTVGNMYLHPAR